MSWVMDLELRVQVRSEARIWSMLLPFRYQGNLFNQAGAENLGNSSDLIGSLNQSGSGQTVVVVQLFGKVLLVG